MGTQYIKMLTIDSDSDDGAGVDTESQTIQFNVPVNVLHCQKGTTKIFCSILKSLKHFALLHDRFIKKKLRTRRLNYIHFRITDLCLKIVFTSTLKNV